VCLWWGRVLTMGTCRDGTATASTPPRTKKAMAMLLENLILRMMLIKANCILYCILY
jgi:hypothetical protein